MITIKKSMIVRAAMTLIFAAATMSAWADEVTEKQALEQAQQFVMSFNDTASNDGKVKFMGRYAAKSYTAEENSTLLLGGDNTLYYPQPDPTNPAPSIGACRAYFQLNGITAAPLSGDVRSFVLNFFDGGDAAETGIVPLSADASVSAGIWYSLDGVRLSGKPTQRGIYINNGRKVVIMH